MSTLANLCDGSDRFRSQPGVLPPERRTWGSYTAVAQSYIRNYNQSGNARGEDIKVPHLGRCLPTQPQPYGLIHRNKHCIFIAALGNKWLLKLLAGRSVTRNWDMRLWLCSLVLTAPAVPTFLWFWPLCPPASSTCMVHPDNTTQPADPNNVTGKTKEMRFLRFF